MLQVQYHLPGPVHGELYHVQLLLFLVLTTPPRGKMWDPGDQWL